MSHTPPDTGPLPEKCAICDRLAVRDITYLTDRGPEKQSEPIEMQIMPICTEHAVEYDMLGDQAFFDRHPTS